MKLFNRFFILVAVALCLCASFKNAIAQSTEYPLHEKLSSSIFTKLKKSELSIIKNRLKPGCLWLNKKTVKPTAIKNKNQYQVLTSSTYQKIVGRKFSLSFNELSRTCKANTNRKKRNTPEPTTTPTNTPTPTSTPIPTLPTGCTDTNGLCPRIFSLDPGKPGEVINIPGGMYQSDSKVFLQPFDESGNPIESARLELQRTSFHPSLMQVQLPSALPLSMWGIWVAQNNMTSEVMYLNKPVISHLSEKTIASGDEFSMWGQMLSAIAEGDFHARVSFQSDTQRLEARVIFENKVKVTVIVPDGIIPGKHYTAIISNGLSPQSIGTQSEELIGQVTRADPLGLKVWWAHEMNFYGNVYNVKTDPRLTLKAIGNGFVDDTPALQAALSYAGSHGGGVVYLPPGTYRTKTHLKILHPNVILQGESPSSTIITYGELDGAGNPTAAAYFAENYVTHSGIANLTIRNLNRSGKVNISVRTYTKTGIEKIFLKNIKADLGPDGEGIVIEVPHLLIADCEINHELHYIPTLGLFGGPLNVGNLDVVIRNNVVRYNGSRVAVSSNKDLFLIGNTFIRNGDPAVLQERIARNLESGGVEFSFTINPVIDSNIIKASQPIPNDNFNDGELLMSQTSIYFKSDFGEISSASETSITDNARTWTLADITSPLRTEYGSEMYVAIVRGPGVGQSSRILGFDGHTLNLDPKTPFKILPTAQSSYVITQWVNDNAIIFNNTLQNGQQGIQIYDGGRDLNIHQNHLIDAASIMLQANDLHRGTYAELKRHPGWNTSITNNTVEATASLIPASIKVSTVQFVPKLLHGNTVFNAQIRDNTIISTAPVTPSRGLFDNDGFLYVTVGGGGTECNGVTYYPDFPYSLLGTVVSGNLQADQNGTIYSNRYYQSRCTYGVNYQSYESTLSNGN